MFMESSRFGMLRDSADVSTPPRKEKLVKNFSIPAWPAGKKKADP
jgi:hypothetical protein